jgi:small subunit ribosomal protein S9
MIEKAAIKKSARIAVKTERKPKVAKAVATSEGAEPSIKPGKYIAAVGRRKTAIARVRISEASRGGFSINGKELYQYFPDPALQQIVKDALLAMSALDQFFVSARVSGGGLHAQAEALRHGISRALIIFNIDFKKRLKKEGYLTRDPRMRERKKFGLKRARKAPQWAKR